MCCGAVGVGAVVCKSWDEVLSVVIVDCPDWDARVTVAGVVLFLWKLTERSQGCRFEG